jgi:DNA mismatch endonuclease (patch repair protein)
VKETTELRSRTMRAVKATDTAPEIAVRRLIHRMGYRFRLYRRDLPGKPDVVLPRFQKVVFVNGCFWHGHDCPRGARMPKTNAEYWSKKITGNRLRDNANMTALAKIGWRAMVVWECELKEPDLVERKLINFLRKGQSAAKKSRRRVGNDDWTLRKASG